VTDLAAALTALEGGDRAGALQLLLERWRATRAPRLAAAVERLGREIDRALPPVAGKTRKALHGQWLDVERAGRAVDVDRLLAVLTHPPAALVGERIQRLEMRPPDPRVAAALVQMAIDCPYTTANPSMWTRVFGLLHAISDPRGEAPLNEFLTRRHERSQFFHRHIPRVKKLVRALREVAVQKLHPAELDELERRIDELAAGPPADAAELLVVRDAPDDDATSEDALLAQVAAAPDDDGPRLVYADWLLERGDPRGELIALQFKRLSQALTTKETRRERALLREHARRWIGPIEPVVDPASIRFERGFLSACRTILRTAGQRRDLVGDPTWATVEQIETDEAALLTHPVMRALRRVEGLTLTTLAALGAHGAKLPIEELDLRVDRPLGPDHLQALSGAALGRLLRLRLRYEPAMHEVVDSRPEAFGWLLRGPLAQRLRSLSLELGQPGVRQRAPGASPATPGDWLRALENGPLRELFLLGERPWSFRFHRDEAGPWQLQLHPAAGQWVWRVAPDHVVESLRQASATLRPGQLSLVLVHARSASAELQRRIVELLAPLAEVRTGPTETG